MTPAQLAQVVAEAEAELKVLARRRRLLTDLVKTGKALNGGQQQASASRRREPAQKLWQALHALLRANGHALPLQALTEAVQQRGYLLPKGTETVRLAMRKKPDLFRRVGRGSYGLRPGRPATRPRA